MSDLTTYKANFKTPNKYLKYFCNKSASEWTLKKYQRHFSDKSPDESKKAFMKNLQIVKNNAKGIPFAVNEHINKVLEPESDPSTSSSRNINNITVKGNYYHAERDVVINEVAERSVKKQKTKHKESKNETKEVNFKQKWIDFLADAEQNTNFHRYSPEKNGVTRLGAKLSPHPHADKEVYRNMKKQLEPHETKNTSIDVKSYIRNIVAASDIDEFERCAEGEPTVEGQEETCRCIKNICKIMANTYMKRPSITRSEVIYNTNMLFPCFEAVLTMMKKNEHALYFVPGEDELESMTYQLKKMGQKEDKRKIYKADGVIRLSTCMDLEVLILETAGAFGHEDNGKTAFDNSKGMFALLSMLKTIADKFKHASVVTFGKLKLYFVQPSGYCIRLWSMQYAKNGLYNYVREERIFLSEDFNRRAEQVEPLINFFLGLKSLLQDTVNLIAVLKREHEENDKNYDGENNSQVVSLSDIICPRIFKLSFNTHGQNFSKEHLTSSPESDF